jgi:hypothetical protein
MNVGASRDRNWWEGTPRGYEEVLLENTDESGIEVGTDEVAVRAS